MLLGRASFEGFGAYWPGIAEASEDDTNRALSPDNRDISRLYNHIAKTVVSDSLTVPADHPWAATTTVIRRDQAATWLRQEKRTGDGDILIFASRVLWNGLLEQGLVDELHLTVSPVALTRGLPLFLRPTNLILIDAQPFPGSGNVLLQYRPAP